MIEDYFTLDTRTILGTTDRPIHLVRAEKNLRWTQSMIDELEQLSPNTTVHLLENAGHWVHVDNPSGLQQLLSPYFT